MSKETSNDEIFELMTKMYGEIQERFDGVDIRLGNLEKNMVNLENKVDTNHKVLHDGYKLTYEKLTNLEDKVDRHDVEIRVVKAAK